MRAPRQRASRQSGWRLRGVPLPAVVGFAGWAAVDVPVEGFFRGCQLITSLHPRLNRRFATKGAQQLHGVVAEPGFFKHGRLACLGMAIVDFARHILSLA